MEALKKLKLKLIRSKYILVWMKKTAMIVWNPYVKKLKDPRTPPQMKAYLVAGVIANIFLFAGLFSFIVVLVSDCVIMYIVLMESDIN